MADTSKIPKIIHQIWMQTEKYVPEKFQKYATKIKEMNPDFKYMFWDEIKILELIKNNEDYMKTYYSFTYLMHKIDFAKHIILYTFGGFIIDMDAYTIKNLNGLYELVENYDVVLSYTMMNPLESFIMSRKFKGVNTGNILAKPNADFFKFTIGKIMADPDCGCMTPKMICVSSVAGPLFLNRIIDEYKGPSKIKILEAEYMEPCLKCDCIITDNTYVLHKHLGSWIPDYCNDFAEFYLKHKIIVLVIFIIILAVIIYFFTRS